MPIKPYGVLKGHIVDKRFGSAASPHYQIRVVDEQHDYRVAVNVQSADGSEVEYVVEPGFRHPILAGLGELPLGFRLLESVPAGLALDFIRGNLAAPADFVPLPVAAPGPDNDLNDKLDLYVERALHEEGALLYAFGQRWGPENKKDKIFGFLPGNGIHDIHMNQGNDAGHAGDDGVWQDGGLLFYFPKADEWAAIFLRFASQAWHTDDKTGHALGGAPPQPGPQPEPAPVDPSQQPDGIVRIVAALLNGPGNPERESVTLLNTSPRTIELSGWRLLDKTETAMPLSGTLGPGEARAVPIQPPTTLSNKGGLITLVNAQGLKVDGVSYTKEQAAREGWTVVF